MEISKGDRISVHYTSLLDDGTVIDSSEGGEPFAFKVGTGGVFPGVDRAVIGMKSGDRKALYLDPQDAYGERREDLVHKVARGELPDELDLTPGQRIGAHNPDGTELEFTVLAANDDIVTLDANPPFSGVSVTVRLEVIHVRRA